MQLAADKAETIRAIRAKAMDDLAEIEDYALAIDKSVRSVWNYIRDGLPVTYIGGTPYVVLSKSGKYWANKAREQKLPQRGRPKKAA